MKRFIGDDAGAPAATPAKPEEPPWLVKNRALKLELPTYTWLALAIGVVGTLRWWRQSKKSSKGRK